MANYDRCFSGLGEGNRKEVEMEKRSRYIMWGDMPGEGSGWGGCPPNGGVVQKYSGGVRRESSKLSL